MWYVYAAILMVVNLGWLFLTLLGLPGNWLMVVTAGLVLWWQWKAGLGWSGQVIHPTVLIVALGIAAVGEALEFFLGMVGAKAGGGGKLARFLSLVMSLVFGLVATFVLPAPIIGSLIGAVVGAFAGAWLGEMIASHRGRRSLRAGTGAAVGRLGGTVAKVILGVAIYLLIAVALWR